MTSIVLIMHRKAIVQELISKLQDTTDRPRIYESNYYHAIDSIRSYGGKVALIEVAESGFYNMTYCLRLCQQIREEVPGCKLLMMCPDQDERIVKEVIQTKGKGLINDFVFYDVTLDYLISKLKSILR